MKSRDNFCLKAMFSVCLEMWSVSFLVHGHENEEDLYLELKQIFQFCLVWR